MPMMATCEIHGRFAVPELVSAYGTLNLSGMGTTCPVCGRMSAIDDGTYDMIGTVVRAFRSKGVTADQVRHLKIVAEQVNAGTLSAPAAAEQISSLDPAIQSLWEWLNRNGQAVSVLLAIIALYVSLQSSWSNDAAVAEQLNATRAQTEVVSRQLTEERIQTEMIAEINARLRGETMPPAPAIGREAPDTHVHASPNRRERRAAARQAQRAAKRPR